MSQQQSRDRDWDWEHWPGRSEHEDGIRHKLRALFTHTEGSSVEELLAERGRELELRTEQLAATIADLQRREERTRELRAAVEEMLRHGSAELDERHAHLNTLAADLGRREEALHEAERAQAERRSELGAVELHRAALERRDAAAAEREQALEQAAAELHERERALAEREAALRAERVPSALDATTEHEEAQASQHLVFAAGERYRLFEREGPAPAPGTVIVIDEHRYVVQRLGASPLPGDRRRVAFAEPAGDEPA